MNDIHRPKWFHFIILYTYIHDVLYVIYNLLKHAFKNRFEEHGDPRSVYYCTGLEFLFPSHRGPLRVYLRAWIWKIQLQLPTPHTHTLPEQHCRTCAKLSWFCKNRCKRQNKYKGIWGMDPKNHHISYHSQKMHIFSGVLYICVAPNHQLFFLSNIITAFSWKCQTLKWNTASEIFT